MRHKVRTKNKYIKINNKNKKNNHKIYIGYTKRLLITIILFIVLLISGLYFLFNSLLLKENEITSYTETSNLTYKVYLKENDFYETDYLDMDMAYIASLINNININFNYDFKTTSNINLNFNYEIVGKLLIQDELGEKTYYEKDYTLLDSKSYNMESDYQYNINETINIDYNYYNSLANEFKSSYGVGTSSNLLIYLKIYKNIPETENLEIDNTSTMLIKIPLSEKSVSIEMNYVDINKSNNLVSSKNIIIDTLSYMITGIILIFLSTLTLIKIIRLLTLLTKKKSTYDKYIKKLLTTYDRMIAESYTFPKFENYNIIKIKKFEELLDIRDNLKLPIMYYNITNHQKSYFYIMHDKEMYLLTIKAVDLDDKNE